MDDKEKMIVNQLRDNLLTIAGSIDGLANTLNDFNLRDMFLDEVHKIIKVVGNMREYLLR